MPLEGLVRLSIIKQIPRIRSPRRQGDQARDQKNWQAAAEHYRTHLVRWPNDFAIWVQLGHMLKETSNHAGALVAYSHALALKPDDPDLLLNLGHLHKLMGHAETALALYRQSADINGAAEAVREFDDLQDRLRNDRPASAHAMGPSVDDILSVAAADQGEPPDASPPTVEDFEPDHGAAKPAERDGGDVQVCEPERSDDRLLDGANVGCLDLMQDNIATGWVWDPRSPDTPATVEFLVDGVVIHRQQAYLHRNDVQHAGYGGGRAGFTANLPIALKDEGVVVHARLAGTSAALGNSPAIARRAREIARWSTRSQRITPDFGARLRARLGSAARGKLSIVMPVYDPDPNWLRQAIGSVLDQWCGRWELICVDDGSSNPRIRRMLLAYEKADTRIKAVFLPENHGIAAATNAGIRAATGNLIGFMDHDDFLEPDAVYKFLQCQDRTAADLIYCDELITSDDISTTLAHRLRPSFSWDYYLSHPYFVHMICLTRDLIDRVGFWDERMSISADIDFVLRCLEVSNTIAHIPAVLYRWRTHASSTGHEKQDKVTNATLGAINNHLSRLSVNAVASPGNGFNQYRIDFDDDGGQVLIVIPTKNGVNVLRPCLESIFATTKASEIHIVLVDHESDDPEAVQYIDSVRDRIDVYEFHGPFNYSKMNNYAVAEFERRRGKLPPYIAFLNNDVEAIETGWLEHMRGLARRPDVGVVGATLLYPDGRIQHSGVIIGLNGVADHAHKFEPHRLDSGERNPGYNEALASTRDYSAVTAACMMGRSDIFTEVQGFDEALGVGFNDTDYCLRVGARGYKILSDAHAVLYHYESATRITTKYMHHPQDEAVFKARWKEMISVGDPYYSPLFTIRGPDHRAERYATAHAAFRVKPGLKSRNMVPPTAALHGASEA